MGTAAVQDFLILNYKLKIWEDSILSRYSKKKLEWYVLKSAKICGGHAQVDGIT